MEEHRQKSHVEVKQHTFMLDTLETHLTYTNSWAAVRLMFWKLCPLRFLQTCLHVSSSESFKWFSKVVLLNN